MLVSILVILIICWSPRVLQRFSIDIMHFAGVNPASFALNRDDMARLSDSLRLFSYVNSVVNFFIYYITSK